MIFMVQKVRGDTCGNSWEVGKPRYLEADSVIAVWERLGRPKVVTYWIGKKRVSNSRTPKGQGFGIWESNPEFDWDGDKIKATEFDSCNLHVSRIKVE